MQVPSAEPMSKMALLLKSSRLKYLFKSDLKYFDFGLSIPADLFVEYFRYSRASQRSDG
jgi:hypothetical protein